MRNLCLYTLFMASAFLMSVGCSPTSVNQGAARTDAALEGIKNGTWKEKIQDRATALEKEGRLLSGVIEVFNISSDGITISKDNAGFQKHYLNQAVNDNGHQLIDSNYVHPGENYILYIEKVTDGLEGEIRVVSQDTAQKLYDTPSGHEFDYDYGDNYKVRGFFRHVALENASYSMEGKLSGQTDIVMSAISWDTSEEGVSLDVDFNGELKLSNKANSETANLGFSNESVEDSDNGLINVLTSPFPMLYPTATNVDINLESAQINPLNLTFAVTITTPSDKVTKKMEIEAIVVDIDPSLAQQPQSIVVDVDPALNHSIEQNPHTQNVQNVVNAMMKQKLEEERSIFAQ